MFLAASRYPFVRHLERHAEAIRDEFDRADPGAFAR